MSSLLIGLWFFSSIIYRGEVLPRPNPDLMMTLNFEASGTDTLKYYRKGDDGSCARQATFQFNGKELVQKVISVNPENASFCNQDPDMQLGTISTNVSYLKDGKLFIEFEMGDETITYIWTPVNGIPSR
ncbi:MAG: hypothetical protein ACXVCP_05100 [Bdellovibrio sp.]